VADLQLHNSAQNRQVEIGMIARFDQSSNQVVDAGAMFLLAINENEDLSGPRKFIASLTGKQVIEAEDLRHVFGDDAQISSYQDAVKEFNSMADSTQSASEIKN
jgi:hypothetical protein